MIILLFCLLGNVQLLFLYFKDTQQNLNFFVGFYFQLIDWNTICRLYHNWFYFGQVGRIPFDQQLSNFENTLNQITGNLGADYMATALARCIFFVGMGSNDYLNNYLMPNYPTRNQYNGQQYADLLVQTYSQQLTVRFLSFLRLHTIPYFFNVYINSLIGVHGVMFFKQLGELNVMYKRCCFCIENRLCIPCFCTPCA